MKIHLSKWLFACLIAGSLFASCNEETVTEDYTINKGYEYFPLEVGKYRVYEVDSTTFKIETSSVDVKKSKTYVKEEIVNTTLDNQGDTIHILERYERKNVSDLWKIKDVWSVKRTAIRAERTEENVKLITMVFPLKKGVNFNAIQFVNRDVAFTIDGETVQPFNYAWNSEVLEVDVQETVNNQNYEVAKVQLVNDESTIGKRYMNRVYAKNVGLVNRVDTILTTQTVNSKPWTEKAEKGYILEQKLIEYN